MRFARWTFLIAATYGVLILVPGFFLEDTLGKVALPPLKHPEFCYEFYGAALACQSAPVSGRVDAGRASSPALYCRAV
jgi:hypothetical protein